MNKLLYAYPRHTVSFDRTIFYITGKAYVTKKFFSEATITEFEKTFAQAVGAKYAVSVSSGREALGLILNGSAYPLGSEIIVSAYNFPPIISVIERYGLIPVFADIDLQTFNIDPQKIKEKITRRTKAVLITHTFGNPCQMDQIRALAGEYGLKIIEDCAHAFGSCWRNNAVGSFGDAAFFSMSNGKNIAAFGGGVITTSDVILYEKIRKTIKTIPCPSRFYLFKKVLKDSIIYNLTRRLPFNLFIYPCFRIGNGFVWDIVEKNSCEKQHAHSLLPQLRRLSGLQAEVGMYQLSKMGKYKQRRREIITYFDNCLGQVDEIKIQETPLCAENFKHYYVVYLNKGSQEKTMDVRRKLLRLGIDTQCLDMHAYQGQCGLSPDGCPQASKIAPLCFEIPSDISLREKDLARIVRGIKESIE